MKFGLWFLSAAAIGTVGTLLAASLPVPPSLPSAPARHVSTVPTQVAIAPDPTPVQPTTPPALPPSPPAASQAQAAAAPPPSAAAPPQAAAASPPATSAARPKRVVAAANAAHSTGTNEKARRPARKLVKATPPDRHRRAVAHAVPKPLTPYPGMPMRERTHVAMVPPPPYGMPPPYWRMPYPPEY